MIPSCWYEGVGALTPLSSLRGHFVISVNASSFIVWIYWCRREGVKLVNSIPLQGAVFGEESAALGLTWSGCSGSAVFQFLCVLVWCWDDPTLLLVTEISWQPSATRAALGSRKGHCTCASVAVETERHLLSALFLGCAGSCSNIQTYLLELPLLSLHGDVQHAAGAVEGLWGRRSKLFGIWMSL